MAALTHLLPKSTLTSRASFSYLQRCLYSSTAASHSDSQISSPSHPFTFSPNLTRRDPKDRKVQWVFLGRPGVGMGTYAWKMSNALNVPHIATGVLVRDAISSSGPLSEQEIVNQGKLVSDEIILSLLSKRLEAEEAKGISGFILSGFPRTIKQAEILEGMIDIDLVVNLKLREDVSIEKCLGRRLCSQCGKNFNIARIDVKEENGNPAMSMAPNLPPAHCKTKLVTRAYDTEEVVKARFRIHNEKIQPVEDFYRNGGKLLEIHLAGEIREVRGSFRRFLLTFVH